MALQAASLVSSAFSVPKDGKLSASSSPSFNESSLFGVSFSDQLKADFVSSSLRCKREQSLRKNRGIIRAQTIETSTPSVSSIDRKKTLRKGNVVVTGASSGLGLATAKALAETGKQKLLLSYPMRNSTTPTHRVRDVTTQNPNQKPSRRRFSNHQSPAWIFETTKNVFRQKKKIYTNTGVGHRAHKARFGEDDISCNPSE